MPLETQGTINTLNPLWPDGTLGDKVLQGDNHIRLIKYDIQATWPNITGVVNATHTEHNYLVGVTSAIQTQINTKANLAGGNTWTGAQDFTGATMTIAAPTVGANPVTKTYADALAFNSALPLQTGNAGKFVTTDGTNASWGNPLTGTAIGSINWAAPVTLASAATVNIGAAASNVLTITGTTTITAFDSIAAGAERLVTFSGALTLTHNATSLILPQGVNLTTAAGDTARFVSLGSGNWRCAVYQKASGLPVNTNITIPLLHVRDERTAGTNGGAASGSPQTRVLNTTVSNTISGASLSTNIVTLPAGTYDVLAAAPGANQTAGNAYKLVLYNNTAAADVLVGWSQQSAASVANTIAEVRGRFTLGVSSALVLRHYGSFPNVNVTELGLASNLASKTEVYAEAIFYKVG